MHERTARAPMLYSSTGSTYEIGRPLGGGGMGRVYLAQQRRASDGQPPKLVALKLLRQGAPAVAQRLFYHEGALLRGLQNPHIVRYIENGRGFLAGTGAVSYLALGYVAGSTTEELCQHRAPLPPATVLGIVAQLVAALDYLHQRGVVHCDIKPANIMLEHAAPRAVLIDFGIARAPDFQSQPVAVGTPQYMAPEQADLHNPCDGRADLYAVGVVVYELLTGKRLFPRRTTTDIRQGHHITVDAGDLSRLLDPRIAAVISRCLRGDPAERYATPAELLDDLRQALCAAAGAPSGCWKEEGS
ncbi:MAG TPA: serine/threonine-protein kinase [Roseiflexaceae bacterium]|nr:serine/threonine-protein kinase [Roseiflexaceae bacterium]